MVISRFEMLVQVMQWLVEFVMVFVDAVTTVAYSTSSNMILRTSNYMVPIIYVGILP